MPPQKGQAPGAGCLDSTLWSSSHTNTKHILSPPSGSCFSLASKLLSVNCLFGSWFLFWVLGDKSGWESGGLGRLYRERKKEVSGNLRFLWGLACYGGEPRASRRFWPTPERRRRKVLDPEQSPDGGISYTRLHSRNSWISRFDQS